MENKEFWDRVNNFIKTSGKTQKGFSKECGFTERRIESLYAGGRLPDPIECREIARVMGVTIDYLLTGNVAATETLSEKEKTLVYYFRNTSKQLQDVLLSHAEALSNVNGQFISPPSE